MSHKKRYSIVVARGLNVIKITVHVRAIVKNAIKNVLVKVVIIVCK